MKDIAVQIINYKTRQYLISCLADLTDDLKSSNLDYEINVLDNASGDDLGDLKSKYPGVSFYNSGKNLGYGGGNNLLAGKTEADYLLFLNPDIRLIEPETIKSLYDQIVSSDEIVEVVGPQLITPENEVQKWDHGEIDGFIAKICLKSGMSHWKIRKELSFAAWVSGAVFLIKKETFDRLGGFDEKFFLYKEEEDLCWRIRKNGGKIIYDPTVKVLHIGHVVARKSEHIQKSVDYFLDKHFKNLFGYRFLKFLNIIKFVK